MPLPLAAAVLAALLQAPAPAPAASDRSAHWKTTVALEGAPPGQALQDAEVWLHGSRMRIAERGADGKTTDILQTGPVVFVWVEGQDRGVRLSPLQAARGRPLHGFVRRTAEIRARGKRKGEEVVDGHPCDVFDYESREVDKGTFWLARDLGDFPVKAVLERRILTPYSGKPVAVDRIEYRNRDVRFGEPIPPERFEPPPEVLFEDVTEIFSNRPRPVPRSAAPPRPTRTPVR